MITVGLVGVGKMGISHMAILGAHPSVDVVAVCDSAAYVRSFLKKQTGIQTFSKVDSMFEACSPDGVFVCTPTSTHFEIARTALGRGMHVFVEKPLTLSAADSERLVELAASRGLINQVGYHNRFIGTFRETRRLVRTGAIGDIYHIDGRAFGQVVIREKRGRTWRTHKTEGGGCLHDYACHVLDLMNFVVGPVERVVSAQLRSVYSADIDDAAYVTTVHQSSVSGYLETNWSDEAHRKMSTTITVYGTKGKIVSDRQEMRVFMKPGQRFDEYGPGWTIRYITDLQEHVDFYLRGEEYTAQIDNFVDSIKNKKQSPDYSFASAAQTDRAIEQISQRAGHSA